MYMLGAFRTLMMVCRKLKGLTPCFISYKVERLTNCYRKAFFRKDNDATFNERNIFNSCFFLRNSKR